MNWKKILCPTDFSVGAREAFHMAASLAVASGAELLVIHVWAPPVYFMTEPIGVPPTLVGELVSTATEQLDEWKVEAQKLGVERVAATLVSGAPWHEIVELAKMDPEIDLVVIGTHGRTGIAHALLGSVTEKVVRHAPCAVLVVRRGR